MIQLMQFPFSHFCEKVRWALDYKGIPYRPVDLLPGLHTRPVAKLAPKTCVPVLVDEETVVQDSPAIIDYLDSKYPDPACALTPRDPEAAREAREWERYLDEEIGVTIRLWFYYHTLPDRRRALSFLLQGATWNRRALFTLIYPKVRQAMVQFMNINTDTAREAEERLRAAWDRLDDALSRRRFLVEDRFSRADLTACALLSPCCLPGDIEASVRFPSPVLEFREEVKGRRSYRWLRSVYDSYRKPLPADTAAAA